MALLSVALKVDYLAGMSAHHLVPPKTDGMVLKKVGYLDR